MLTNSPLRILSTSLHGSEAQDGDNNSDCVDLGEATVGTTKANNEDDPLVRGT